MSVIVGTQCNEKTILCLGSNDVWNPIKV